MTEVDPDKPEDAPLFLPSQFTATQRSILKLEALAQVEYGLREGQAYDALADLRTAIRTFNYNKDVKGASVRGVGRTTRAQKFMKTLSNDIQAAGDSYRRTWVGLVKLGMSPTDNTLRRLEKKQKLEGKGGKKTALGDSKKAEPWFWNAFRPSGMSEADEAAWEVESKSHPEIPMRWFRERALRDRAIEEVETVEAEFGRVIAWFRKNSEIWERMAEGASGGAKAYTHKQAERYRELGEECVREWARAPALVEEDRIAEEKKVAEDAQKAEQEEGLEPRTDYSVYTFAPPIASSLLTTALFTELLPSQWIERLGKLHSSEKVSRRFTE
ncbi:hypothetical protein B0H16DRAFT_1339967 [Mycena metata]|uniref:Uncharacterized protein n=1 Tax=Mycena metata TaxID=1033252 RepID=A0AAD7H912_9AGAR|nr:hypothetical protein B0H16DRAFT_1339967 [Mycena metata]